MVYLAQKYLGGNSSINQTGPWVGKGETVDYDMKYSRNIYGNNFIYLSTVVCNTSSIGGLDGSMLRLWARPKTWKKEAPP